MSSVASINKVRILMFTIYKCMFTLGGVYNTVPLCNNIYPKKMWTMLLSYMYKALDKRLCWLVEQKNEKTLNNKKKIIITF